MKFQHIRSLLNHFVERATPGVDCVIYQNHRPVFRHSAGFSDVENKTPITGDEIYYLYSCSKPVTCTAALQLLEQGKYLLNEPLKNYLPEFSDMYFADGKKVKNDILIRHLFTMSAGFDYNLTTPEIKGVLEKNSGHATTREVLATLAQRPLSFEPGTHWQYSLCHDVLALLVEVVSGKRFRDYAEEHIFAPLGMSRTSYGETEKNKGKIVPLYRYNDELKQAELEPLANSYIVSPEYDSGGAGMVSCVDDYILFEDALACGGVGKNGERILSSNTINLMRQNFLSEEVLPDFNWSQYEGYGYGLGVRTMINPVLGGVIGSLGEFGWAGAAGAICIIDPSHNLSLYFAQHMLNNQEPYQFPRLRNAFYAAIDE